MPDEPIGPATPFFIVSNVAESLGHYVDNLGFACRFAEPVDAPFFAIVGRGAAQIMIKDVGDGVDPLPNPMRHSDARWDAFIYTADPDALSREFASRAVPFHAPLADASDRLRGFSVADPDGYVCFFGRPK